MAENLNKLTENELAYALGVLDSVGERSVDVKELSKYHSGIIDWLLRKELLIVGEFKVEGRVLEKRATLGRRAFSFTKNQPFDYRMNILKAINNG